jgi:peroxin-6
MLKAVTRQASLVDAKIKAINADLPGHNLRAPISTAYFFDHFATQEDTSVMVTEQDFLDAHRELVPSVSAGELAHYERVRAAFEGKKDDAHKEMERANGTGAAAAAAPARLGLTTGRRTTSGASTRTVIVSGSKGKGKGKGKAVSLGSEGEYEEDYRESGDESSGGGGGVAVRDKGKGKEIAAPPVAGAPFGDGQGSGDEGLYD